MGVTKYNYGNGALVHESRSGGVTKAYSFDALGSTTMLRDMSTGTKTDQFAYQAYGTVFNRTGSTATPFQYVGAFGYYNDGSKSGLDYLRARYRSSGLDRFLKRASMWPIEAAYGYVNNQPTMYVDPSGLHQVYWPYPKNLPPGYRRDERPRAECNKGNEGAVVATDIGFTDLVQQAPIELVPLTFTITKGGTATISGPAGKMFDISIGGSYSVGTSGGCKNMLYSWTATYRVQKWQCKCTSHEEVSGYTICNYNPVSLYKTVWDCGWVNVGEARCHGLVEKYVLFCDRPVGKVERPMLFQHDPSCGGGTISGGDPDPRIP